MTEAGQLICDFCREPFERPHNRGPAPRYCSAAHRQAAHRARREESPLEAALDGALGESIAKMQRQAIIDSGLGDAFKDMIKVPDGIFGDAFKDMIKVPDSIFGDAFKDMIKVPDGIFGDAVLRDLNDELRDLIDSIERASEGDTDEEALDDLASGIGRLLAARHLQVLILVGAVAASWQYIWFLWCVHWLLLSKSPESAAPVFALDWLLGHIIRQAVSEHEGETGPESGEPLT